MEWCRGGDGGRRETNLLTLETAVSGGAIPGEVWVPILLRGVALP